jgi:large subunit ribosomal protein L6
MSRIGRIPISIPKEAKVEIIGQLVKIQGPKGEIQQEIHSRIKTVFENQKIIVRRISDQPKDRALHGLTQALLKNVVFGVMYGYEKSLELVGVGYRVTMNGKQIEIQVGLSHTVVLKPPVGIEFKVEGTNKIKITGVDKQKVGQIAADIRKIRPPEPYKQKGIRYVGEFIRKKAGKVGVKTA